MLLSLSSRQVGEISTRVLEYHNYCRFRIAEISCCRLYSAAKRRAFSMDGVESDLFCATER